MDLAEKYAKKVINGDILACKWVKLACERHLYDLETAEDRGLVWNPNGEVEHVLGFFRQLKLWV